MNPYLLTWIVLAAVVVVLAAYRYSLVRHEDATLDVLESGHAAREQSAVYRKAHTIELWGRPLTVVVILYGLALVAVYAYQVWSVGGQVPK
jgi:hypothetical protein